MFFVFFFEANIAHKTKRKFFVVYNIEKIKRITIDKKDFEEGKSLGILR